MNKLKQFKIVRYSDSGTLKKDFSLEYYCIHYRRQYGQLKHPFVLQSKRNEKENVLLVI
jgi:hypothetical protein